MAATAQAETPLRFAQSLLQMMDWPQTPSNLDAMVAWEAAEGGAWHNTAAYNPLNTTYFVPGSRSAGTGQASVKAYNSWAQGLQATAATLSLNEPGYAGIRQAFASGQAGNYLPAALNNSAWGTNGNTVAKVLAGGGYRQYGSLTSASGSPSGSASVTSSQCVVQLPLGICLLDQAGLNRVYGILLIVAGGALMTMALYLIVQAALQETKAGQAVTKSAGGLAGGVASAVPATRVASGSVKSVNRVRGSARTAPALA